MPSIYLHEHPDFDALLSIVAEEKGIIPTLIEKDYWIMHVLHGLQKQGLQFELKGGTSLSKGYKIIQRFSEDIDIHIHPPAELKVEENPKKTKEQHVLSRKKFYDWMSDNLEIHGISKIERDTTFDDEDAYRSGGIRLLYDSLTEPVPGVKAGILLEAGFDIVTPNSPVDISSWALDNALEKKIVGIINNMATSITCYHPGYTFVEKLQTIATKYRKEKEGAPKQVNYMRQYYDVYCLLNHPQVQSFIGTPEYDSHKQKRFPKKDLQVPISQNEAFLLSDAAIRKNFSKRYQLTKNLYYQGQPTFEEILARIKENIEKL
jgi:hypothetical protein